MTVGASYQWDKDKKEEQGDCKNAEPVVNIIGNGAGWAKVTKGPVKITANGQRTVVRVSGPGGWKITGPEEISG